MPIYLDDIIIWSDLLEDHMKHFKLIMDALCKSCMYCNLKKSQLFLTELECLGHHILHEGIQGCSSKVNKILQWPVPKSVLDVQSFLGLVQYITSFLPYLMDHRTILTPLTAKKCKKSFPSWTREHQCAFDAIKALVVGHECLTVVDHTNPGENNFFFTCDVSDFCAGTVLSWGKTWETA